MYSSLSTYCTPAITAIQLYNSTLILKEKSPFSILIAAIPSPRRGRLQRWDLFILPFVPHVPTSRDTGPCSACDGIYNGSGKVRICCAKACGTCRWGPAGACHNRSGGTSDCCPYKIRNAAAPCSATNPAPCSLAGYFCSRATRQGWKSAVSSRQLDANNFVPCASPFFEV